jgi:hypothetical protein
MVALSPPVAADPSAVVTVMPTNGDSDAPPWAAVNTHCPDSAAGPPSAQVVVSKIAGSIGSAEVTPESATVAKETKAPTVAYFNLIVLSYVAQPIVRQGSWSPIREAITVPNT